MEQYKIDLTHLVVDCVGAKSLSVLGCGNVRKWVSPKLKKATHFYSFLLILTHFSSFLLIFEMGSFFEMLNIHRKKTYHPTISKNLKFETLLYLYPWFSAKLMQ